MSDTPVKTELRVKVIPRSSRDQIVGENGGILKIKVTAAPEDGKANKRLQEVLASALGVSKRDIRIRSGARSRVKSVEIQGLGPRKARSLLGEKAGQGGQR